MSLSRWSPTGVVLGESFLVVDAETRMHYVTGKQIARAVRGIVVVQRPRAGDTSAQWLAGLVDTGQLDHRALVLAAVFPMDRELGEVHWVLLDEDRGE